MNRLHGLSSLGIFAGGLGAVAANAAGLSTFTHLVIVAAIMAVALVFVTRNLLPDDEEGHGDAAIPPTPPSATRRDRLAPIILVVFAGMFAVITEVTGGDWAAFRLADDFDAAAALASLAFVAYTVGMTSMRFGGDWLQLRLGRIGLHRLSVGLVLGGFAVASLVPNEAASIVGFLLVGLGVATFLPKLYDDAARLPGRRGAGLGAMTAGMRVAYLVTPVGSARSPPRACRSVRQSRSSHSRQPSASSSSPSGTNGWSAAESKRSPQYHRTRSSERPGESAKLAQHLGVTDRLPADPAVRSSMFSSRR